MDMLETHTISDSDSVIGVATTKWLMVNKLLCLFMLMISTLLANPKLLFMQQSHRCLLGMVPCYQLESAIPSKHLWWCTVATNIYGSIGSTSD